jgi:hypothetical protein
LRDRAVKGHADQWEFFKTLAFYVNTKGTLWGKRRKLSEGERRG